MNKTFTLCEFVVVARAFISSEYARLSEIHKGQENYQESLVDILDRLERLKKWFEERRVQYLLDLAIEFSLVEQGLPQTATTQQGQGPGQEQPAEAKESRTVYLKECLEAARAVVDLKIDFLQGCVLGIKMAAFSKF